MEAVKISPKFQVVIPKRLREALKLSPGQKLQVVAYGNRIEMIPLRKLQQQSRLQSKSKQLRRYKVCCANNLVLQRECLISTCRKGVNLD